MVNVQAVSDEAIKAELKQQGAAVADESDIAAVKREMDQIKEDWNQKDYFVPTSLSKLPEGEDLVRMAIRNVLNGGMVPGRHIANTRYRVRSTLDRMPRGHRGSGRTPRQAAKMGMTSGG